MTQDNPPTGREIRLDIDVPGTPEEVWEAIATGHGITSWFVPSEVDGRPDGTVTHHFSPDYASTGQITAWEPPHRFVYSSEMGEQRLAYEWLVESRGGAVCRVRLVNSGFLSGAEWDAEWDAEIDALTQGWTLFLFNLRLCRLYFPGQWAVASIANASAPGPRARAWTALTDALGIPATPHHGDSITAAANDAPPLAGTVERFDNFALSLRLTSPAPGIALVAAEGDESVAFSVYIYAFGPDANDIIARDSSRWRTWLGSHFETWPAA